MMGRVCYSIDEFSCDKAHALPCIVRSLIVRNYFMIYVYDYY